MQSVRDQHPPHPDALWAPLPYEYDRVMGVASVGSQESVRFGEENDLETEDVQDTAAHSRETLDQTHEEEDTYHNANPGIGEFHGGFGSASLGECLGRVAQSTMTPSATCHSGEGIGESTSHMTNPPHETLCMDKCLDIRSMDEFEKGWSPVTRSSCAASLFGSLCKE